MHCLKRNLYRGVGRELRHSYSSRWCSLAQREIATLSRVAGNRETVREWYNIIRSGRVGPPQMARRVEAWEFGAFRYMGITTRPADRAAQHGVRNPLPTADGSPEKIEEERQDVFLRGTTREAASRIEQVEEAVGGEGGASFEAADDEVRNKLGMNSADNVLETAEEFTKRSESHSMKSESVVAAEEGGSPPTGDIDQEVHKGLVADSEHPAGRVVKNDETEVHQPEGESVMSGVLGDWAATSKEAETDRTDKVHPYSADKLYSSDEALDKAQVQWEEGKPVESGASKLDAENHEKSEGVYGSFKPPL